MTTPGGRADELARAIIAVATAVHGELGPRFSAAVYREAVGFECLLRGIPAARQVQVLVPTRRGRIVEDRVDFLVDSLVVVRVVASARPGGGQRTRVAALLKSTGATCGILINFRVATLANGVERIEPTRHRRTRTGS